MPNLPRVKAGDAIAADDWNALLELAERCGVIVGQGSGLISHETSTGTAVGIVEGDWIWIKITGGVSGSTYPFTQQFPAASGAWTNGTITGNAYEVNSNGSVANPSYARAWRTPGGDWRFQAGC